MSSSRFDPERHTAWYAVVGVIALAAAPILGVGLLLIAIPALLLGCLADTRELYLLGPYLRTELRSHSRQTRVHLWRFLVAFLVGFPILSFQYVLTYYPPQEQPPRHLVGSVAAVVFLTTFWMLVLLTGATMMQLLSKAIVEDRESQRHDFILTTDLRGRELVIGKTVSRFLGILAYPAAGLPLIVLMPVLFRMDPGVIVFSFAYGFLTLFSVAGLSALASVLATNKQQGQNWLALFIFPYLLINFFANLLKQQPMVWFFPGSATAPPRVSLGDVVEWVSVGNPLALLLKWLNVGVTGNLGVVASDLRPYASFHLLIGGIAFLLAARWIRQNATQAGEPHESKAASDPATESSHELPRTPIGDEPVLWKDYFCHPIVVKSQSNPRADRISKLLLVGLPIVLMLASCFSDLFGYRMYIVELSRYYPMLVTWMVVVYAGQLGTMAIAREREKDTLIMLATTSLTPAEIFHEKFRAIQQVLRGGLKWQLAVGIPSVLCGSYSWWGYLGLVIVQVVIQTQLLAWGMRFSANAPNVLAAQQRFGIATGIVVFCACLLSGTFFMVFGTEWPRFLLVGLFPPLTILATGFTKLVKPNETLFWVLGFFLGMLLHGIMARAFYVSARNRFLEACDPGSAAGPLFDNRATS